MFEPSSMSPVYVLEVPGQNPFSPSKKPLGEKGDRGESSESCEEVYARPSGKPRSEPRTNPA